VAYVRLSEHSYSLFSYPLHSSDIRIKMVHKLSGRLSVANVSDIGHKCFIVLFRHRSGPMRSLLRITIHNKYNWRQSQINLNVKINPTPKFCDQQEHRVVHTTRDKSSMLAFKRSSIAIDINHNGSKLWETTTQYCTTPSPNLNICRTTPTTKYCTTPSPNLNNC